ncbi:MAG: hypothetical protein Q7R96_00400 [Nanoarchaeota archaeon]|nr:hypothetical protein [Nanoarchaeota archaeon]
MQWKTLGLITVLLFLIACVEQPAEEQDADKRFEEFQEKITALEERLDNLETKQPLAALNIVPEEPTEDTICASDYPKVKDDFLHVREQLKNVQDTYISKKQEYNEKKLAFEKAEQDVEDAQSNNNGSLDDLEGKRDELEEDMTIKKRAVDKAQEDQDSLETLFEKLKAELSVTSMQCNEGFIFNDENCKNNDATTEDKINSLDDDIEAKKDAIKEKEDDIDTETNVQEKKDLEIERDQLDYELDQLETEQDLQKEKLSLINYRCDS